MAVITSYTLKMFNIHVSVFGHYLLLFGGFLED